MNQVNLNEFEQFVEQLNEKYTLVSGLVDQLMANRQALPNDELTTELQIKMDEIKEIENRIAPTRDEIVRQQISLPATVSNLLKSIAEKIEKLLPKIHQLENESLASKDKLGPQIKTAATISRMQNAYARNT